MKTVIAFLTKTPSEDLLKFAGEISEFFDIYVIIDDNNYKCKKNNFINLIQIDNDECKKHSFVFLETQYNDTSDKNIYCWEKAIYYFNYINTDFDYVWFIEEDVFISSIEAIIKLENKCDNYDLVCAANDKGLIETSKNTWMWNYAFQIFKEPSYCSMVCACRISKKLLISVNLAIQELKDKHKLHFFIYEFFLNTIAMKLGMSVYCPEELLSITYDTVWNLDDFKTNKDNFFHPFKKYELFEKYRNIIHIS